MESFKMDPSSLYLLPFVLLTHIHSFHKLSFTNCKYFETCVRLYLCDVSNYVYDIEFFSRSVHQTTYLGSRLAVDDLPGSCLAVDDLPGSRLVNAEISDLKKRKRTVSLNYENTLRHEGETRFVVIGEITGEGDLNFSRPDDFQHLRRLRRFTGAIFVKMASAESALSPLRMFVMPRSFK
ncbi:hypothetical protein YC2023_023569 [Brassica napus]